MLLFAAIIFAIIELLALIIGTRLTRTVTGAIAQLYEATKHINRGDFSHRISVKSHDQLATLANSFNSMTSSIENLIEEQKEKQRLQNELTIAQEVQAQLFPQHISQLDSLEVFGFCRPARTVSGDYYDFLTLDSEKLHSRRRGRERKGNFGGPADGDHPFRGSCLQPGGYFQHALAGRRRGDWGFGRWRRSGPGSTCELKCLPAHCLRC